MDFFLSIFLGLILGGALVYLWIRWKQVPSTLFQEKERENLVLKEQLKIYQNQQNEGKENLQNIQKQLNDRIHQFHSLEIEIQKLQIKHNMIDLQLTDAKDNQRRLEKEKENLLLQYAESQNQVIKLQEKYQWMKNRLEEQEKHFDTLREQSKLEFGELAQSILDEKAEKFNQTSQNQLKQILEPFQKDMNSLKSRVDQVYIEEAKERFSLGEKVKELAELNRMISEEARSLTRALKGENKTQGNWGEMILESILEKSGLTQGREYEVQHQLRDEANKHLKSESEGKKMQPDVVISYPDGRKVIIDSKVSLNAYLRLSEETEPSAIQTYQNQHLQSVRNHIRQLSEKGYDDYNKTLDFVMMFIPSEPAYIAAMQADPELWNFAYDRRIILISPTNLITSLKLIKDLWRREDMGRNAQKIAEQGEKIYNKLVTFTEKIQAVGNALERSQSEYQNAFKTLSSGRGNLLRLAEDMRNMGVKTKKNLPENLLDTPNAE